jgi:poly-beta-1,6-N-acetyl-D-glucosamine synthase
MNVDFLNENGWFLSIAIGIAFISLFVQMGYYLFVFRKLAFHTPAEISTEMKPVSIIISARNEYENLNKNIYSILEQAYPEYQVIVINDCSWDDTKEFLEELEKKYSHLKVVTIVDQEKYRRGKKFALTLGIKAAKYDHLLFTDADCKPATDKWLNKMQSSFSDKKKIVLGYGAYEKGKGLLNKLIRFETFYIATQYLSFALHGIPYMGVGRNLAYHKELFFANKGFARHNHLLSGDDDLFINDVATKNNVSIQIHPESFTYSEPKKNFSTWGVQKVRHISTVRYYKNKHRNVLFYNHLTQVTFYVALIALLVLGFDWRIVIGIYFLRLAIQLFIFGRNMKKLNEFDLFPLIPLFDFFLFIFYPVIGIISKFSKNILWK